MNDLFDAPIAHRNDPVTSYEAGRKMIDSGMLALQEDKVYGWIKWYLDDTKNKDFTAREVSLWNYRTDYHTIQRRLSGLHRKGKIERTGEKRNSCAVWKLKNG